MEKWKHKVGLLLRFKLAWKAFWLQSVYLKDFLPQHFVSKVKRVGDCDMENCEEFPENCLSRGDFYMKIGLWEDEHNHVCWKHTDMIKGRFVKLEGWPRRIVNVDK